MAQIALVQHDMKAASSAVAALNFKDKDNKHFFFSQEILPSSQT